MSTAQFTFPYAINHYEYNLTVSVHFPLQKTINEHCVFISQQYDVPCFLHDKLKKSFTQFIRKIETQKYFSRIKPLIEQIRENPKMIETISLSLSESYKKNWIKYNENDISEIKKGNELSFKAKFDQVSQSHMDSLIQFENELINDINRLYQQIDSQCSSPRPNPEMESSWKQRIISKKTKQRENYVNHVDSLSRGNNQNDFSTPKKQEIINSNIEEVPDFLQECFTSSTDPSHMFTNNIRLIANLPVDLSIHLDSHGNVSYPERIDSLLSLYANRLNGVVVFTDDILFPTLKTAKGFIKAADRYVDFQFDDMTHQLEHALQRIAGDVGDVLITKHSNLNQIHVAFHLLCNPEELRSASIAVTNVTFEAMKNVVNFCAKHSVVDLTVPLYLTDPPDLSGEEYDSWCCRRADVVLKTVRGALHDLLTSQLNITFVIPRSTSIQLFDRLVSLVSDVYKQRILNF